MSETKLKAPWLVAVWPGMGNVAISAGYYLMAKLGMHLFAEFSTREFFDLEQVEVKDGLIRSALRPSSRLFAWSNPQGEHDLLVFIGEAQPPAGKYAFCRQLVDYARELGVERVFTFAAMATQMRPEDDARVFGAATDDDGLATLEERELPFLNDGHIGGLNGVLLGVAAERGLSGTCLLGEMPHLFANFPFPKASLAVLEAFTDLADIEIDTEELSEQARAMENRLAEILSQVEQTMKSTRPAEAVETSAAEASPEPRIAPEDEERIDFLFERAKADRSRAYEAEGRTRPARSVRRLRGPVSRPVHGLRAA